MTKPDEEKMRREPLNDTLVLLRWKIGQLIENESNINVFELKRDIKDALDMCSEYMSPKELESFNPEDNLLRFLDIDSRFDVENINDANRLLDELKELNFMFLSPLIKHIQPMGYRV